MKFELPKYFVIKCTDDPRFKEYIDWLNKKYDCQYDNNFSNFDERYYWYDWNSLFKSWTDYHRYLWLFQNNPTEITLDQREEAVKVSNLTEELVVAYEMKKKSTRAYYTYTTKYTRSDWVEFTKEEIDGRKVEDIEQEIKEKRKEAKRLQGLLKSHSNLDF